MVTDGICTCVEHSIMYKEVESLCCIPEGNRTLCVNLTQLKKLKKKGRAWVSRIWMDNMGIKSREGDLVYSSLLLLR